MKQAIIVGASTGIGRALAKTLSAAGYELGLISRKGELLQSLQAELPNPSRILPLDIGRVGEARNAFAGLMTEMGSVELVVLNAALGLGKADWEEEQKMIAVNIAGTTALAHYAFDFFLENKGGHLVGISSVAALRGYKSTAVYNASKAYMANYLEGLRHRAFHKKGIFVTELRPGFIDTPMTKKNKNMFWLETPERAAHFILRAIQKRKAIAYVPPRWALIGWLYRKAPDWIYFRL